MKTTTPDAEAWHILLPADLVLVNASLGPLHRLVPDRNCTIGITNPASGRHVFIRIEQGATPYTVTADLSISGTTDFGITATANAVFFFHLYYDDEGDGFWEFVPGDQAAVLAAAKAYTDAAVAALSSVYAPLVHHARHENGGADEISVAGLSGLLADGQTPIAHKASHQNGGSDEIDVGGLSGVLADPQTPASHGATHLPGNADAVFTAATAVAITNDTDRRTLDPTLDTLTQVANVLASHLRDCHANKIGRVS